MATDQRYHPVFKFQRTGRWQTDDGRFTMRQNGRLFLFLDLAERTLPKDIAVIGAQPDRGFTRRSEVVEFLEEHASA